MKMKASEVLNLAKKARFIDAVVPEIGMTVRLSKKDILSRLYMLSHLGNKEIQVYVSKEKDFILIGQEDRP